MLFLKGVLPFFSHLKLSKSLLITGTGYYGLGNFIGAEEEGSVYTTLC